MIKPSWAHGDPRGPSGEIGSMGPMGAHGLLGWDTTRRELNVPSGIQPELQGTVDTNSLMADVCF